MYIGDEYYPPTHILINDRPNHMVSQKDSYFESFFVFLLAIIFFFGIIKRLGDKHDHSKYPN